MAEFLLDTDISSYIMQGSHKAGLRRLQTVPIGAVAISFIPKSELPYGVEVSPRRQQESLALSEYLRHVEVLDFPDEAALHYAQIRDALKASGAIHPLSYGRAPAEARARVHPSAVSRHRIQRRHAQEIDRTPTAGGDAQSRRLRQLRGRVM
jgi:predicted nucleic acid-binding protein